MTENVKIVSIDNELALFGENLKPSDRFHNEGKRLAQNVFLKLAKLLPKEFSLAEPHFAGSFGKATDVIEPDLDLYVVINNRLPPFDDVLDVMERILEQHQDELEILKGSMKHSTRTPRVSNQFSFQNGMEVDILSAAHLEPAEVLAYIAKDPEKNFYVYNTSLVSIQLAFMKSHDSFTHSLIRLSKFWIKSLSFGDRKFPGGSTIMELIGCASAEEEQRLFAKPSMLRALTRVMQIVCELDSLKLAFEPISSQSRKKTWWQRVPLSELAVRSPTLIPSIVGTKDILLRNCFIVEPANPYYDHLYQKSPALIQKLKEYAGITKKRLTDLMFRSLQGNASPATHLDFVKTFEPQPANLKAAYPSLQFPTDFCMGYAYPCKAPYFISMTVRKDDILEKKEIRFVIETVKWNLLSVIHSIIFMDSPEAASLQAGVETLIKTSFCLDTIPSWARQDRHDQMDVTTSIPYHLKGNVQCVKFSMSWKKSSKY